MTKKHPVSRKRQPARKADGKDDQFLTKLTRLWKSHHKADLVLRWKTGKLLNKRLGLPKGRQSYGRAVVKKASKLLGLATSELSRMRWFAYHFTGLKDLKQKHPNADSWTKVKELLPTLNSPKKKRAGKQLTPGSKESGPILPVEVNTEDQSPPVKSVGAPEPTPPPNSEEGAGETHPPPGKESGCYEEFVRCLRTARDKLPAQPLRLDEAAKAEVLKALQELMEDALKRFQLPCQFENA